MKGYLLVKTRASTLSSKAGGRKSGVIFFGDGLEKAAGTKTDLLKNIARYFTHDFRLDVEDDFTLAEFGNLKSRFKNYDLRFNIRPFESPVDRLREIKDAAEISCIKKSVEITAAVFGRVKKVLAKRKWSERELAGYIVSAGKRLGAESASFEPIVAAGTNAAVPHHIPGKKELLSGEPIIIDFGFKYKGYCSDFTRTVFLKKASEKWTKIYNQVEKAYLESISFMDRSFQETPKTLIKGLLAGDVYQKAVEVLAEKRLDKYFIHNLGHGAGLEIHEPPNLSPGSADVLVSGMVFSIEPGVYFPKAGGIRIEDLVCLNNGGVEILTRVSTELKENIIL